MAWTKAYLPGVDLYTKNHTQHNNIHTQRIDMCLSTGTSFCCWGSPTCKGLFHGRNANVPPKGNLFGVSPVDKVEPEPAVGVCRKVMTLAGAPRGL